MIDITNASPEILSGIREALGVELPRFLTITETDTTATHEYFGGVDRNGNWKINRYDADIVKSSATIANNAGYADLATAWVNRETLTYE